MKIYILILIFFIFSCKKTDNLHKAPLATLTNVIAYYPDTTINVTSTLIVDSSVTKVETSYDIEAEGGINQLTGSIVNGTVNYSDLGFIKGFETWGEDLKVDGFNSENQHKMNPILTGFTVNTDLVFTIAMYDKKGLVTSINTKIEVVADTTLFQ